MATGTVDRRIDGRWHLALAKVVAARARSIRQTPEDERALAGAVHKARTTLKRLRAFWRLARPSLPEGRFQRENDRLRHAARQLQPLRELHVLVSTLDALETATDGTAHAREGLRPYIVDRRRVARETRHAQRSLPRVLREIDRSLDRLGRQPLSGDAWVRRGLRRSRRRARKARKAARRGPREFDERFHTWRKRAKVLLYQLEALEPLGPAGTTRVRKRLDRVQEILGDDHDLAVLARRLDDLSGNGACLQAAALATEADRRSATLRRKALRKSRGLFGRSSKAIVRRMLR